MWASTIKINKITKKRESTKKLACILVYNKGGMLRMEAIKL
jgi:hypothetical protein